MRRFFVTMSGPNRILRVCQVDASRLCNVNIVAAMSEESVMKQALSPEVPARVRRGQFRAITLGIGASALAMACSFGSVGDDVDGIGEDVDTDRDNPRQEGEVTPPEDTTTPVNPPSTGEDPPAVDDQPGDSITDKFDPNDPFSSEEGAIVADI